jgi:hypothetical protein
MYLVIQSIQIQSPKSEANLKTQIPSEECLAQSVCEKSILARAGRPKSEFFKAGPGPSGPG